eukprot:1374079-Rhodomonas_salina.1
MTTELVYCPFQAAELPEKAFRPLLRPDRQNSKTPIFEVILDGLRELGHCSNGNSSYHSLYCGRGSSG